MKQKSELLFNNQNLCMYSVKPSTDFSQGKPSTDNFTAPQIAIFKVKKEREYKPTPLIPCNWRIKGVEL
jgi:hypothetical protein